MDSSSQTLFSLLRAALGNEAVGALPSDIDWKEVIDLSFDQGVAAIAVDGFGSTGSPTENEGLGALDSPELEDLKYEWFGSVFQAEEDYKKYVEDIASLAKAYSEAGIEMMVLKGYGLSLNYPVPAHRPVGDVDIFLNDNDDDDDDDDPSTSSGQARLPAWRRGDEVIRRRGIAIDYSHHHHSVFSWKGPHSLRQTQGKLGSGQVMVENHYDIENRYASRKGRQVDDLLKRLSQVGRKEVAVGDSKVFLPSADFNGIFLISHSASHFAGDHITLRHLLDWALFVDKEWKEIDWPFVTDWLSRLGLLKFFTCMNALSIDYLGISTEKFPSLDRDIELEKKVLEDIIHPTFSESGSGFFYKLRRLRANMWKRNLVATEALVPRLARLAWSHVVRPEKWLRVEG